MSKKEPVLGDEIVIKGTGRRWSGVHFPVTIVDVSARDLFCYSANFN
jgi:hypothetical protein